MVVVIHSHLVFVQLFGQMHCAGAQKVENMAEGEAIAVNEVGASLVH